LTIGKLCYEVKELHYDLVIVDAAASGHFIGHLSAPVGMNELAGIGAIGDQTKWMLDILEDAAKTGVVVVTTPEETPVAEALELCELLQVETSVPLAGVVANRVLPELFGRRDASIFERLSEAPGVRTIGRSALLSPDALASLIEAAKLSMHLRTTGVEHLDHLRAGLASSVPLVLLPMLFSGAEGAVGTAELARALLDELA